VERLHLSFEQFAEDLTTGLSLEAPEETERSLMIEEVKVACTFGMLQCLDRPHRLAYILGEILDLPGPDVAEALDISPDLFRKRLQHARTAILTFTRTYCGLASDTAACSSYHQTRAIIRQVDEARWALEVHRSSHPRASSVDFARRLIEAIDARRDLNSDH
jgi:hypothetical protein